MNKQDVIDFFDSRAASWDAEMIKNDSIIGKILDNAEVFKGQDVLDVACGTGVMIPFYLERGVNSVTGIDISPEMAKIAGEKFKDEPAVSILCGDVEETVFDKKFDRIVVYNAFPHFPDPQRLIRILSSLLKEGGRLTVAHGASRESIDGHHKGSASKVSMGLMSAERLRALFAPYFSVEAVISNSYMYQVSGVKLGESVHSHDEDDPAHEALHAAPDDTPIEKLLALMNFMVGHNDSHVKEIVDLAAKLKNTGREQAYLSILDAAENFRSANAHLRAVMDEIIKDEN